MLSIKLAVFDLEGTLIDLVKRKPFEDIEKILIFLQNKNIPMAILTNKPELASKATLQEFGLIRYFDPIVGPDTYDALKPDPRGLINIMRYHGVSPQDTLMIGDSDTDIQVAQAAGTHAIAVCFGHRTSNAFLPLNPTYIAPTPNDLLSFIQPIIL